MRCDDFRVMLEDAKGGAIPEALRAHLEACSECRAYAEDWAQLSEVFRAAATEPLPEPSIGFAVRLLRRLDAPSGVERVATEFVERVGRRVAFATIVLAMLTLLALGLPSTGPVREPSSAELMAQAYQVSNANGIVFADETWMSQASKPLGPGAQGEPSQK
jgi:predicted anti-sigma-YlaC factor YlaD